MKLTHRANPTESEEARNWGPEGELAIEMETAVRNAILDQDRGSGNSVIAADVRERPVAVVSSYRLRGRAIARNATGYDRPDPFSVYYVPKSPNIVDQGLFAADMIGVLVELNKHFATPGSEWNWDVLEMTLPYVFEFSMGPKPWRWLKRFDAAKRSRWPTPAPTHDMSSFGHPAVEDAIVTAEEAVARRQNLLLVGPETQCGMLARRLTSMFPTAAKVAPAFRAPHSSISMRAMIGSDRPGEADLAKLGVLYLADYVDFTIQVLRALRDKLEEMGDERPLVVAQISSLDYRSEKDHPTKGSWRNRHQNLLDIIRFPLVAEIPNLALSDFKIGTASEIIRKRIMERPRGNPASKGKKPTRVVARLAREMTPFEGKFVITGPRELADQIGSYMDLANEMFFVLFINVRNGVIGYYELTSGMVSGVTVHPAGIFQAALLAGAAGMLTVHNHPSGNPSPSPEDYDLWERLTKAGELMGIPVMDNLVIGAGGRYWSQREGSSR